MRILLVEDEQKTGDYLKQDGLTGKQYALSEDYDVIILDVMLPGVDGWHIIEAVPRDQIEDRVKGLELGADDYLVKPFAFAELLARIKSLLRRGQQREDSNLISIANLELDIRKRRVTREGQRIDLTAKEFALMELFMRRRGEILPRALIASQVWDMNFDSDTNVVEVAIKRLRNKIDSNFTPKLIQNIRGMGYVLEVEDEA
ncbi:unnamed protein product [Oppiella nova]|uniref:DNA-binding response regulator n=1 Tax=Oppiella nova TaxID=334625 RepID=A0A7R9L927_9ACAR|nr:unnamed protein product [Oppiella nova]CAG2160145.1 unnamed protein product [Oppiella nova]